MKKCFKNTLIGGSTLLAMQIGALACKHDSSTTRSSILGGTGEKKNSVDALLIHEEMVQATAACRNPLINITVSALTDGLLRNAALSGLGTENPVGKKMKADSAYFQGLRIVSIMDYEWSEGIMDTKITPCLPPHIGLHLGTFTKSYIAGLPEAFPDDGKKLKTAAALLKNDLENFQIVSLAEREALLAWPKASKLPLPFQAALQAGVREKILYDRNERSQNEDPVQKLKAMTSSFTPLYLSMNAALARGATKTYVEAYLPPFFELKNANLDELESWSLKPGLTRAALPKSIDISVAKLTHIGYLQNPSDNAIPLIKVQMFKDWQDPNRLHTRTFFGEWKDQGSEKGALSIDTRDYRNALYIAFYPYASPKPSDNALVRKLKSDINALTANYQVEARIHSLALDFVREPASSINGSNELRLKPKFSMRDSNISFRLHQKLKEGSDGRTLKALGFTCETLEDDKLDCYQDFGVYSELRDFFLKGDSSQPQENNLATAIGKRLRDAVNSVIAHNVKYVIDQNMSVIEDAIDLQFEEIVSDLLEQQKDMHEKVRARLESQLFLKKN